MHFLSYLKCAVRVEQAVLDAPTGRPVGAFSLWHIPGQRGKKSLLFAHDPLDRGGTTG
jgi:hypothetical protein